MTEQYEPKYYRHFEMHMKNGEILNVYKDYDIPVNEGLIEDFKRGDKKFLELNDPLCGSVIPYDQISFIVIGDMEIKG